jgi:hypothetical protein
MNTYIGPITVGASFMFVSIQNNIPYILNGVSYDNGISYYWESDYGIISKSPTIPVFSASGSLSSLKLKDSTNGGGLSFRQDGVTIGNSNTPSTIIMSQNTYANWDYPDIFLANITYSMTNPSNTPAQILITNSGTGPTIVADNIIIIPGAYYYNCTSTTCKQNTNIKTSISNWFCSVNTTYCNNKPFVTGWTELDDGSIGFEYPYCPINSYCGSIDTCKGPCSASIDTCVFSNDNYICKLSPSASLNTNWISSTYFLIAIVALGFFIVMGIILLFYIMKKSLTSFKTDPPKIN